MREAYRVGDKAYCVVNFMHNLDRWSEREAKDPTMKAMEDTLTQLKDVYPRLRWHSVSRWFIAATMDPRSELGIEVKILKRSQKVEAA